MGVSSDQRGHEAVDQSARGGGNELDDDDSDQLSGAGGQMLLPGESEQTMTRERAKELLPVIRAFSEGKNIQIRPSIQSPWSDTPEPHWSEEYDYRIKPEPREWWVCEGKVFDTKQIDLYPDLRYLPGQIHVREVLDE